MRSFSKLRAFCSHPETLPDRPSKARDEAAALGTLFHKAVELRVLSGRWPCPTDFPDPVCGWVERMTNVWEVPDDLETEVACGLADEPIRHVVVREREPHVYESVDGSPLLTAGRADLVWEQNGILNVCDIKTGQSYLGSPNDIPQLQAQCLALSLRESSKPVVPIVYYARLGMFDRGHVWGADMMERERLVRRVREAAKRGTEPNPGVHCLGCWSKRDCRAYPERRAA